MKLHQLLIVVSIAIAGARRVTAQTSPAPPHRLTLVPDTRIAADVLGIRRDPVFVVGSDGRLVASERFGGNAILAVDSAGAPLRWKVATGRGDDAEVMYAGRMGWVGTGATLWVDDPGYRQVAIIDRRGSVVRSFEHPSWVHPHWADRRKYPLFAGMQTLAVYPDSTMLVIPDHERSLISTPGYDPSVQHLVRMSPGGAIERAVATIGGPRGFVEARGHGGSSHTVPLPLAARTFWEVSSDGQRIVVIESGLTAADSGAFRVTALNDHGDTVYTRRYVQPAERISAAMRDSALSRIVPFGATSADSLRADATRQMPAFRSPVTGVFVGHDYSVWVLLRPVSDTATEHTAAVLDDRGAMIGTVALPSDQTPVAVDRSHLWTIQRGRLRVPVAVIRYRLADPTPARPTRSAPASASSKPSRPGI